MTIKCDECSKIRNLEIAFETMEQYRAHLKTSGHEINYTVYMDLYGMKGTTKTF